MHIMETANSVLEARSKWEVIFTRSKMVEEIREEVQNLPQERWLRYLEKLVIVHSEMEQECLLDFQKKSDVANALGLL